MQATEVMLEDVPLDNIAPMQDAPAIKVRPPIAEKKDKPKRTHRHQKFPFVFDANRLCLLSDGILAIAITLLVLDITVPDPRDPAVDNAYVSNYLVSN
jgi:hypothetical protein